MQVFTICEVLVKLIKECLFSCLILRIFDQIVSLHCKADTPQLLLETGAEPEDTNKNQKGKSVKHVIAQKFEYLLLFGNATKFWVLVGCLFTIMPITRYLSSCEHHQKVHGINACEKDAC